MGFGSSLRCRRAEINGRKHSRGQRWNPRSQSGGLETKTPGGVGVYASGNSYGTIATTDANGKVQLSLAPGDCNVIITKRHWAALNYLKATVTSGQTNHTQYLLTPLAPLTGTIYKASGAPATGVRITLYQQPAEDALTDDAGTFQMLWDPKQPGFLIAHDWTNGLAATSDLTVAMTNIHLVMQPTLTVDVKATDENGSPVTNAQLTLYNDKWSMVFDNEPAHTDASGLYEYTTLPRLHKYTLDASANGYVAATQEIECASTTTNRVQVELVLRLANRIIT
jgi:hypothetical protein